MFPRLNMMKQSGKYRPADVEVEEDITDGILKFYQNLPPHNHKYTIVY